MHQAPNKGFLMLTVTPLYAALIAFVYVALSARVIIYRRSNKISLGDAGDNSLLKRMRAQANCAEYAPFGLLLLAMVELTGASGTTVHILGIMLLLGRVMHGYGFSASPPIMNFRVGGMVLTLTMILASAVGLLSHAVI